MITPVEDGCEMAASAKKAFLFEECYVDRTEMLPSEESIYSRKQMKLWLEDSSDEEDSPRDSSQSEEPKSYKQMIAWLDRGDAFIDKTAQGGVDEELQLVTTPITLKALNSHDKSPSRVPHDHPTTANEEFETDYCHNRSSHIHGAENGAVIPLDSERKKGMVKKKVEVHGSERTRRTHRFQDLQPRGRNNVKDRRKQTASYSPRRNRVLHNKRTHECENRGDTMHRTLLQKYLSLNDIFTRRFLNGVETDVTNVDMETKEVSPLGELGKKRNCTYIGMNDSPPINGREDVEKSSGFNVTTEAVGVQKATSGISSLPSPVRVCCTQQDLLRLPTEPSDMENGTRSQLKASNGSNMPPLPHSKIPMAKTDEVKLSIHVNATRELEFFGNCERCLTDRIERNNKEQQKKAPLFMKTFRTRPALDYEIELWQNGENESSMRRFDELRKLEIQPPRSDSSYSLSNVAPPQHIKRVQHQIVLPKLKEDKRFNTDMTELEGSTPPPPPIGTTRCLKVPQDLPDVPLEVKISQHRVHRTHFPQHQDVNTYRSNTEKPSPERRRSLKHVLNIDIASLHTRSHGEVSTISDNMLDDDNYTLSTFESSALSSAYDIFEDPDSGSATSYLSNKSCFRELPANDVDRIYLQEHIKFYETMIRVPHLYFGKLTVRKQATLLRQLKHKQYFRNEYIIKKGDPSNSFYIITGPRLETFEYELAGVSVVVDDMGKEVKSSLHVGSYFGERSLICSNESERSETVRVTSAYVDVVRVDKGDFADWKEFRTYAILKDITWLSGLPTATLHALQECLQHKEFSDGSHIVEKGDIGDAFYIIYTGTVEVVDIDEDGREIPLVQLYEGQAFGDLALLYGEPRNATVKAKGSVSCLILGNSDFRGCLDKEGFMDVLEGEAHTRQVYTERRKRIREAMESVGNRCIHHSGSSYLESPIGAAISSPLTHKPITTSCLNRHRRRDGKKIINKYEILGELGRGAYGIVMQARHLVTKKMYAMKILNKGRKHSKIKCQLPKILRREVAVMKRLRHPNIVTLWEVIDDPNAHQLYLVQDYMDGGGVLPEGCPVPPLGILTARLQLVDCIRGLHYLHSNRIIHGDIKPANLLMDKRGSIKIADFGAARFIRKEEQTGLPPSGKLPESHTMINLIGTPMFMAPELFGEDALNCVGPEIDVWALGVTLFQMIYGTLPFWYKGCSQKVLKMRICCHALEFPQDKVEPTTPGGSRRSSTVTGSFEGLGDPLWPSLRNLLKRFLDKDPKSRITLDEVISHPWVTVEGSWPQEPLPQESCNYANVTQREIQNAWLQVTPRDNRALQLASSTSSKSKTSLGFFLEASRSAPQLEKNVSSESTMVTTTNDMNCGNIVYERSRSAPLSPPRLRKYRDSSSFDLSNSPMATSHVSSRGGSMGSITHFAESSLPLFLPQDASDSVVGDANHGEGLKSPSETLLSWLSETTISTSQESFRETGVVETDGGENYSSHHLGSVKYSPRRECPPCKGTSSFVEDLKQSSKEHQTSSVSTPPTSSRNPSVDKSATYLSSGMSMSKLDLDASNCNFLIPSTPSTSNMFSLRGHWRRQSSSGSICGPNWSDTKCQGVGHVRRRRVAVGLPVSRSTNGKAAEHDGNHAGFSLTPTSVNAIFPRMGSSSLTPRSMVQQQSISVHLQQQQKGGPPSFPTTPTFLSSSKSHLDEGRLESDGIALHRDDNCFQFGRTHQFAFVDNPEIQTADSNTHTINTSNGGEDNESLCSEDIRTVACDSIDQVIFNSKTVPYIDSAIQPLHPSEFQSLDIAKPVQSKTFCFQSNDLLGIRFGRACEQGYREHLEDCYTAIGNLLCQKVDPSFQPEVIEAIEKEQAILRYSGQLEAAAFFAVYDGHNGAYVAKALQKSMYHCLLLQPSFPSDMRTAIENACKEADGAYLIAEALHMHSNLNRADKNDAKPNIHEEEKTNIMSRKLCLQSVNAMYEACSKEQEKEKLGGAASFAGSTAVMAVVCRSHGVDESVYVWVASVGDCRAVLCKNNVAVALSLDHTPMQKSEAERIIAANGFINRERVNGMLGVTRAFGDIAYKQVHPGLGGLPGDIWSNQLISKPEITKLRIQPEDNFLILACDGVFSSMSNSEAVAFVQRRLLTHQDVQRASRELVRNAVETSCDNCTCLVVCFNQFGHKDLMFDSPTAHYTSYLRT